MHPFAPTQSLHFWALHILSFPFICTLRWCKHCTGQEVAANFRKFPFTALYGAVGDGVLWRPVTVGAPFAPIQGLHFWSLHILSFPFICTLRWCKHCTGQEVAAHFCKFPFTALYGEVGDGVLWGPVTVDAPFAPIQGLHFWALLPLSILFRCTLHWCDHCTG